MSKFIKYGVPTPLLQNYWNTIFFAIRILAKNTKTDGVRLNLFPTKRTHFHKLELELIGISKGSSQTGHKSSDPQSAQNTSPHSSQRTSAFFSQSEQVCCLNSAVVFACDVEFLACAIGIRGKVSPPYSLIYCMSIDSCLFFLVFLGIG